MLAPTIYATALIDKLDEFLLEFAEHDREITAGVASVGDAAAYSLVWEFGNVRQVEKGPKTVQGISPDTFDLVWLSIQAPYGYIRIHENDYIEFLKEELGKVRFESTQARGITEELEEAAIRVAKRCAKLISETAPWDKGELSKSIEPVNPGDPILDDVDDVKALVLG